MSDNQKTFETSSILAADIPALILTTSDVSEDAASVTFTATLSNAVETDMTITTDQGVIVVVAGDTSGTLVINTQNSDPYLDATSITATVIDVDASVDISSASATAQITDSIDTTFLSLRAFNTSEDENSALFIATLSNATQTDVTITTDQGDIEIARGSTTGVLRVNTQDSDVYLDASSVTVTVSSVSGGNFEAVDFSAATATAQIRDTIDTTTLALTTNDVNEDAANVTFTATLSNPAETDFIITTDQGEITIAAGETTGTLVIDT
ncbi:immunoglobulin-like domain-containing protein, partial [Marinomonas transparens]